MNEFLENSLIDENTKKTIKLLCELFYTAGISDTMQKINKELGC